MPEFSIADFFQVLASRSEELRKEVPGVLKLEDEDEIIQRAELRSTFCEECMKLYNAIADKEDELSALKRKLREMMRGQRNDQEKLDRRKWFLIRSRKLNNVL